MGWHTLRLRTRILLGYGLILILTSLLTLFLNSRANALNEQIKELNDAVARETMLGVQLDGQVASTQQAIDHYLLQPVPENLRTANDSLLLLFDMLSTAQSITSNAAQRQRLEALSAQLGAYQRDFQNLTALLNTQAQLYGESNQSLVDATTALDTVIARSIDSQNPNGIIRQGLARVGQRVRLASILNGRMAAEQVEQYGIQAATELALASGTLQTMAPANAGADDPAAAAAIQLTRLERLITQYAANIPRIRQQRQTVLNKQGAVLKAQAKEISQIALDRLANATTELEQESRRAQQL